VELLFYAHTRLQVVHREDFYSLPCMVTLNVRSFMYAWISGPPVFRFSEGFLETFVWVPWIGNIPTGKPLPTEDNTKREEDDMPLFPERDSNTRSQGSRARQNPIYWFYMLTLLTTRWLTVAKWLLTIDMHSACSTPMKYIIRSLYTISNSICMMRDTDIKENSGWCLTYHFVYNKSGTVHNI
jgi:hypothetical protein